MAAILFTIHPVVLPATEYYVATTGGDTNPGTALSPWQTIQKAANTILPGDSVIVGPGAYPERVTSVRGGTNASSRIKFITTGAATIRGFKAQHPYLTLQGFDVTGWNSASSSDAQILISSTGDYFELVNCTIRDGVQIAATNVIFSSSNSIFFPSGGLISAGFRLGQTIQLSRATNVNLLTPQSSYTIASLSDTNITVAESTIVSEGPKPAYLTGSPNYGLFLDSSSEGCVIRSNVFRNLSYRYWFIQGSNHLFEFNEISQNNGWDLIFYMGSDHIFRRNYFHDNGWGTFQPSADVFDDWPVKYERITFSNNFVQNMTGVINAQKRNDTVSGPLWITHNVFTDIGWFSIRFPNTFFENNTLLRVARTGNVAVQVEQHPVILTTSDYSTNCVVRNNIFVDCGQATGSTTPDQVGWYRFVGPTNSVFTKGNFVSGPAPTYAPKSGFNEGDPLLNGGDPGFGNINDPVGPDGVPFTDDDGLRLRADSKLRGRGDGLVDLGAYNTLVPKPKLSIVLQSNATVHIAWPLSAWGFGLQSAPGPLGPWSHVTVVPDYEDSNYSVSLQATGLVGCLRLSK
jgi:hypothetical protein